MPDETDYRGGCRGGITPGSAGNRLEAPIGLATGPPQAPLAAPSNAVKETFARKCYGRTEIGLYRTVGKAVDYSKPLTTMRSDSGFGGSKPSAYVTMECDCAFVPRAERLKDKEVFQAYMFIRNAGMFLPNELAAGSECVKRSLDTLPKPDGPTHWDDVRKRLIQHENGHLDYTLEDLKNDNFLLKWELERIQTYDEFKDYVEKQVIAFVATMLDSRKHWDNIDIDKCNNYLRDEKYIQLPLEKT